MIAQFNSIVILIIFWFLFCAKCEKNQKRHSSISYTIGGCKEPITALILARGGSKGIQKKNLQKINGISLLSRTISTILSTKLFPEIWVSTDSNEIADEAEKSGALIHKRADSLATESSIDAVQEFIRARNNVTTLSGIALFQCTSPFLNRSYIEEAYHHFKSADCVFSVTKSYNLRWTYETTIDSSSNEFIVPINFNPKSRPRRQDWRGELLETGMFYFATRNLIEENIFQNKRCKAVLIQKEDSMEIDSAYDLKIAKLLFQVRNLI